MFKKRLLFRGRGLEDYSLTVWDWQIDKASKTCAEFWKVLSCSAHSVNKSRLRVCVCSNIIRERIELARSPAVSPKEKKLKRKISKFFVPTSSSEKLSKIWLNMSTIKQSRNDVMAEKCHAAEKKKEAIRKIEESEKAKCFLWDIVATYVLDLKKIIYEQPKAIFIQCFGISLTF